VGALAGLLLGLGALLCWQARAGAPQAALWPRPGAGRYSALLRAAAVPGVTSWHVLAAQAGGAVLAALAVLVLTGAWSIALCCAAFAGWLPVLALRRSARRRAAALRERWPEAIDNLASAVRAGMSLPEGLAELGARGPVELRGAFVRFGAAHRASGRFGDSLDGLKAELADPVGDRVCETVRMAREVGGSDLGTVLRTLADLLRADSRTRAELEARQGWVVTAARLAVAAPWAVLLLLGSQASTLAGYDSAGGATLLGIGAGVCAIAYRIMVRIGRLPTPQRVLR
jgi:tight adherence protein B